MESSHRVMETEKHLSRLIGLKLIKVGGIFATRQFYFGPAVEMSEIFDLSVECAWRIEVGEQILTGSEDYPIKAEDNVDPSWEEGMPSGHLQEQLLRDFLGGEMVNQEVVIKRSAVEVRSVVSDTFGGFRLRLTEGVSLAVFPTTCRQMEWMLSHVSEGSVMLINGRIEQVVRR